MGFALTFKESIYPLVLGPTGAPLGLRRSCVEVSWNDGIRRDPSGNSSSSETSKLIILVPHPPSSGLFLDGVGVALPQMGGNRQPINCGLYLEQTPIGKPQRSLFLFFFKKEEAPSECSSILLNSGRRRPQGLKLPSLEASCSRDT